MPLITGLHHVNLIVPPNTLAQANAFYGKTLGLTPRPVPELQKGRLAWFDIGTSGQQVHIAFGRPEVDFTDEARQASRHPCFKVGSLEELGELQRRVWEHFTGKGEEWDGGRPLGCDEPGKEDSGAKGVEYPTRFFARDYAGNRLEFTL
ncbi:hypothetical protein QBC41DRAFT_304314 [Cercophora samala]|uniref:VOC domain-containing protein n=1 Tax=Cercophora samala TaxID=330535 RepID=A0AA40DBG3_9PEZI|nr:hypothetical protein QBC41DRAFT_304314 [Cercophora samala]